MVVIEALPDIHSVERMWRALEKKADHSFFLSWPWIGTWLSCLPTKFKPSLLTVTDSGGEIVASALLVRRKQQRFGIWRTRSWLLHTTGDPALDKIYIEYNGLLSVHGVETASWTEVVAELKAQSNDWDEIRLDGISPELLQTWQTPKFETRESTLTVARYAELEDVRQADGSISRTLSANTRGKIKRSQQAFAKIGPIAVDVATSRQEAHDYLEELKTYHERRWATLGKKGAFSYPFFEQFHNELITNHFEDGVVQLLRVRAGNKTIGILYNFVHRGIVYHYQSGFDYDLLGAQESPGLLTHALAIDYNAALGHARYDLMAGDSQYKRSLAKLSRPLWWGAIQRDCFKFKVEAKTRALWKCTKRTLRFGPET